MKSLEEFEAYLCEEEAQEELNAILEAAGGDPEALKTKILELAQEKGFEINADQLECLSGKELEDDNLSDAAGGRGRTRIPWLGKRNETQNLVACGPERNRVVIIA